MKSKTRMLIKILQQDALGALQELAGEAEKDAAPS